MQAPIGDTAMKTQWSLFFLLVALAAACGDGTSVVAPPTNDTGTSVPSDGGTPTPDVSPDSSSPPVDAAVDNDATPPNDTPVVMNDAGTRITCEEQVLSDQVINTTSGYHLDRVSISGRMTPAGLLINLVPYGPGGSALCNEPMSSCVGERLTMSIIDTNGHDIPVPVRFEIHRQMLPSGCSPRGDFTITRTDTGTVLVTGTSDVWQ